MLPTIKLIEVTLPSHTLSTAAQGMIIYGILLGTAITMVTKASTNTMALYKLGLKMGRVRRFIDLHDLSPELASKLKVGIVGGEGGRWSKGNQGGAAGARGWGVAGVAGGARGTDAALQRTGLSLTRHPSWVQSSRLT